MKRWTPSGIYNAKPWAMVGIGTVLCGWAVAMSVVEGEWDALRGLGCGAGAALVIIGGSILQLRHTYRANSKWRRSMQR